MTVPFSVPACRHDDHRMGAGGMGSGCGGGTGEGGMGFPGGEGIGAGGIGRGSPDSAYPGCAGASAMHRITLAAHRNSGAGHRTTGRRRRCCGISIDMRALRWPPTNAERSANTALHLILGLPIDHWERVRSTSMAIVGSGAAAFPMLRRVDRRREIGGGHEVLALADHRSRTGSC